MLTADDELGIRVFTEKTEVFGRGDVGGEAPWLGGEGGLVLCVDR